MGAYNELVVPDDQRGELEIQFKYGVVFQFKYRLGDKIQFSGEVPDGVSEIPGTAFDPKTARYRFFVIKFNGDEIKTTEEVSEAEFKAKFG
jgi:hypothetical protein